LIKSAVSRQREFLADASAVQFTRNPPGIAGALKKIGGTAGGARLESSHAEEASHLFFGNGVKAAWFSLLSTHPPLDERIRRIEPKFDGKYPSVQIEEAPAMDGQTEALMAEFLVPQSGGSAPRSIAIQPEQAVARVGTLDPAELAYAANLVGSLPSHLHDALHDPVGAQAVAYSLLLDGDPSLRQRQREHLAATADPAVYGEMLRLESADAGLGPEFRLPAVDMALPALQQLSAEQYRVFRDNICGLIEVDQQIRLFEFALNRVLLRNLDPVFSGRQKKITEYYSMDAVTRETAVLLSALAHVGQEDADHAMSAFSSAAGRLGLRSGMVPLEQCGIGIIDEALDRLAAISAPLKKQLLEACAACVSFDGRITVEEAELFRAVADSLECPMPPFVVRDS
jgi:hypothetical protein